MKKLMFFIGCIAGLLLLNACDTKLDEKKCVELILQHPFFACRHVGVTDKELPDCQDVIAGSKRGGYYHSSGSFSTAYYYYLYGFGVTNVHDLEMIDETKAICKFNMVEINKTSAYNHLKDDRIKGESMTCQALFIKYEDGGWKLERLASPFFTINIWDAGGYKAYINFNSFD